MNESSIQGDPYKGEKRNYSTLTAFIAVVIIGGSIGVAVRISNLELSPFWGAGIRAAVAFWLIVVIRRIDLVLCQNSSGWYA